MYIIEVEIKHGDKIIIAGNNTILWNEGYYNKLPTDIREYIKPSCKILLDGMSLNYISSFRVMKVDTNIE